jgi:hypothetical protein
VTPADVTEASVAPLLDWAGTVLAFALDNCRDRPEPVGGLESLRGLVLSREGVLDGLAASRAAHAFVSDPPLPAGLAERLSSAGMGAFEAAAVGLALAVELDPSAARAVAYLHDDVRLGRLSVDLLAGLCAGLAGDWTAAVRRLATDSAVARSGLLTISALGGAAEIRPTSALVRHAAGVTEPEPALAAILAAARPLPIGLGDAAVAGWAFSPHELVLHVHGAASDVLTARVATALAAAGQPAVQVDLAAIGEEHVAAVVAHCLLGNLAALLVLPAEGHPALLRLLQAIDAVCLIDPGLAFWQAQAAGVPLPVASVELRALDAAERAAAMIDALGGHGMGLAHPTAAEPFARRYRHGPEGIARLAAATAARLRADARSDAQASDILQAATVLAGAPLRDLATRVNRSVGWTDLAVPEPVATQLRELCARVDIRDMILDDRGYSRTIGAARGVSALFAGPSGAGKTLAASVVACELGLSLYRVDLARVVSKYIGETERNLEAVFAAAESTDVVLLFDEADALFGRRSEVTDAHDRYANLEVAYLLQRIEAYDGVAILSTNLLRNLDDAFTRRLDFRVLFPFPGEDERRRMWRLLWPAGERLADDVDLDALAGEHELSGGMIRNAVLAAAHLAAFEQTPVSRRHLDHAIRREHDKLGRLPRLFTSSDA